MTSVKLRHSARAIILDEHDRILLCRFGFPHPAVPAGATIVWAAPGGGIEHGETPLEALDRELREEVGLVLDADPPHVWHQEVIASGHAAGYDGVINDYFLIRTSSFTPHGTLSDDELTAEHITGWQWWPCKDIADYRGTDLFSPRDLATLLIALITNRIPAAPVRLGL
ncbi:NUDIX domain-containing protein [Actinopolymorpha sp. B11F2]|uniref:NUDIX hydrolase n=1 Tax=Actinopolymorpha sp. B11F2 TaxID=3160862 RepID=UPI0032E52C88